jgi:hypothetical protein
MPDFREQIQNHYQAQGLPAQKVDAILREGRAAAVEGEKVVSLPVRRTLGHQIWWAVAASVMVLVGLAVWWNGKGGGGVPYAEFAPRIVQFFGTPPELPKRSQKPEELREWLLAQGAPVGFQIPVKLRGLKSFGCQVLDVHGKPAYLTCFWAEKKPGVDEGSLVHLLVARRSDFQGTPTGTPTYRAIGDWSFAAWTQRDVVYTLAANAPLAKLKLFVLQSGGRADVSVLAAGILGCGDQRW